MPGMMTFLTTIASGERAYMKDYSRYSFWLEHSENDLTP